MGPAFWGVREGKRGIAVSPRSVLMLTSVFPVGAGRAPSAPFSHGEYGPCLGPSPGRAGPRGEGRSAFARRPEAGERVVDLTITRKRLI